MAKIKRPDSREFTIGTIKFGEAGATSDAMPSFEEWCTAANWLDRVNRASQWWLGDWLMIGEEAGEYEGKLYQIAEQIGLNYNTASHLRATSKAWPIEDRRPNQLSHAHHEVLNSIPLDRRGRYLDLAIEHSWSVKQFREEVAAMELAIKAGAIPTAGEPDEEIEDNALDLLEVETGWGLAKESVDLVIADFWSFNEVSSDYLLKIAAGSTHVLRGGGSLLISISQAYLPMVTSLFATRFKYQWCHALPKESPELRPSEGVKTCWTSVLWYTRGAWNPAPAESVLFPDLARPIDVAHLAHHSARMKSMGNLISRLSPVGGVILASEELDAYRSLIKDMDRRSAGE